mmetsp:Transcript_12928/g.24412  ORF Transcript_12928/g.24412 Transcript_12928/m.24412 type:complete len:279 (+) Transcript_12928:259-1095(+)
MAFLWQWSRQCSFAFDLGPLLCAGGMRVEPELLLFMKKLCLHLSTSFDPASCHILCPHPITITGPLADHWRHRTKPLLAHVILILQSKPAREHDVLFNFGRSQFTLFDGLQDLLNTVLCLLLRVTTCLHSTRQSLRRFAIFVELSRICNAKRRLVWRPHLVTLLLLIEPSHPIPSRCAPKRHIVTAGSAVRTISTKTMLVSLPNQPKVIHIAVMEEKNRVRGRLRNDRHVSTYNNMELCMRRFQPRLHFFKLRVFKYAGHHHGKSDHLPCPVWMTINA